ncbi:hypothetical protein [Azotobacter chroococcum]|uniref:hypothetical protein n=1 Tax=Azotobacter chroococcum TaxID=353 RepID=UPI0005858683|nr:hypothetical protein [Azotobacter chroococcum]
MFLLAYKLFSLARLHTGFATKATLTGLVALDRPALKAYLVMTIAPFERQVVSRYGDAVVWHDQ